jgi:hypothetical protein
MEVMGAPLAKKQLASSQLVSGGSSFRLPILLAGIILSTVGEHWFAHAHTVGLICLAVTLGPLAIVLAIIALCFVGYVLLMVIIAIIDAIIGKPKARVRRRGR